MDKYKVIDHELWDGNEKLQELLNKIDHNEWELVNVFSYSDGYVSSVWKKKEK